MPIKQIQLRGISRTPSDRASADGGCAESLNVHLDQNETAPTLPPDDISGDIYPENPVVRWPIVFIHKMLGVINYIGHDSTTRGLHAYGETLSYTDTQSVTHNGEDNMEGATLGSGETLKYVSSIGNTLIVYSDKMPYYFFFKEGSYHFLGTEIPKPAIDIISRPSNLVTKSYTLELSQVDGTLKDPVSASTIVQRWNKAKERDDENYDELLSTWATVWNEITLLMDSRRIDGIFFAPFFIRYALRLYDGTYIHISSPILCGGGREEPWLSAKLEEWKDLSQVLQGYAPYVELTNCFKVRALISSYSFSNWKDIVKSIDFFASTPIYTPAISAPMYELKGDMSFVFDEMDEARRDETIKKEVLSKGQFYKIRSFDLENESDLAELYSRTLKITASDDVNGGKLPTHDDLEDGYRTSEQYIPLNGSTSYNNRLLLMGVSEILPTGDSFLNGQYSDRTGSTTRSSDAFKLIYKIVVPSTGEVKYIAGIEAGQNTFFRPGYFRGDSTYDESEQRLGREPSVLDSTWTLYHNSLPYGWIAYPDTRCVQVEVFGCNQNGTATGYRKVIPLEPHPYLECACAFLGFGVSLADVLLDSSYKDAPASHFNITTDRQLESSNKLLLSAMDNPFLYPAENMITFPDSIVGAALTSVPLSEGQVGDFDVYVFTKGGIRVLKPNAEGTFATNIAPTNLARYVALPGTIFSLEQAVVFITEKGVMILTGGNITEISRNMNGRPYVLDDDLQTLIGGSPLAELVQSIMDGETFMGFMDNAKIAYDHTGARLIFFNPEKVYQYVYMLDTQTWHKIFTGITNPTILNSYPECLISCSPSSVASVMDFSTVLDDEDVLSDTAGSVKGVIITRPFTMEEPDIRKAIRDVRIRGKFNRDDVQYILLGSFDDIHWKRLHSLRGGSYKSFRIILLCNLAPTERITWIDVDYESRFANKLR